MATRVSPAELGSGQGEVHVRWPYSGYTSLLSYFIAVAAVAAAAVARWLLSPVCCDHSAFLLFLPAVMVTAWYAGLGPAIVATLLGAMVADYFWVKPLHTIEVSHIGELVNSSTFVVLGLVISWLARRVRKAKLDADSANRAKDQFLAALSHELRNPLTPALITVSALAEDDRLPSGIRDDLESVRSNLHVETSLIDDLLDINRIAKGKLHLNCATIDVHPLIKDLVSGFEGEAQAKTITLSSSLGASSSHVLGDAVRLRQVLWNLLRNALKFTPVGGRIQVLTGCDQRCLRIEVCDTGIGIEPQVLPRIFDAFAQGHSAITRQFGGLGLGLAIAKGLVDLHGGVISVHSLGKDRGATFVVELPLVAAPTLAASGPSDEQPTGVVGSLRILLVEDHPDSARLLARLLRQAGHDVQTAPDVRSALALAASHEFDLLISDLGLPDGSGLDLMRQLRQRTRLTGICLSGYGMEEDIRRSAEVGFAEHLVKPIDYSQLCQAIRRASAHLTCLALAGPSHEPSHQHAQ